MLARELLEELTQAEDLPSLPAVAVEILRLTRSEDADLDEFATVLSRDPVLVARLFKYANSAKLGTRTEITTVRHSIMMLGLKTVKLVCLGFSLTDSLRRHESKSGLDLKEYWRRSLVNAVSGHALASRVGDRAPGEAFLCGLLTHFGKLVLDQSLPEQYREVFANGPIWPTIDDEKKALGFHSAEVGAAVLAEWGLPDVVSKTVAFVHRPDDLPSSHGVELRRFVDLMHLNSLFEGLLCDQDPEALVVKAHARARNFGFRARDVEYFLARLTPALRIASEILSIEIPSSLPDEETLERVRSGLPDESAPASSGLDPRGRRAVKPGDEEPLPSYEDRLDAATGLPNRAAFDDYVTRQIDLRLRTTRPGCLGLVLLRLDRLEDLPSAEKPGIREEILRQVTRTLVACTRKNDMWACTGRSVFAMVLANTVPLGIKALTERLRTTIEGQVVDVDGATIALTTSIGASWLSSVESEDDGRALVRRAHRLLRRAQREGGNRCARGGVKRR